MAEFKTEGLAGTLYQRGSQIKISNHRYECPKHGVTDAAMFVRVYHPMTAEEANDFQTPRRIMDERIYCLHCYVDALDKLGVSVMTKVSD